MEATTDLASILRMAPATPEIGALLEADEIPAWSSRVGAKIDASMLQPAAPRFVQISSGLSGADAADSLVFRLEPGSGAITAARFEISRRLAGIDIPAANGGGEITGYAAGAEVALRAQAFSFTNAAGPLSAVIRVKMRAGDPPIPSAQPADSIVATALLGGATITFGTGADDALARFQLYRWTSAILDRATDVVGAPMDVHRQQTVTLTLGDTAMTAPYLQGSAAVPEATALILCGIQTDPYGEVRGGHRALYDYSTLSNTIANGAAIDNLIAGGADGVMSGYSATGIDTYKGIRKIGTSAVYANLGDGFDLLNFGSEPSVVVSAWMTHEDLTATLYGIFGYASGAGSNCQYEWATGASGYVRLNVNGTFVQSALLEDQAYLHTAYFRKTAAGAYEVQAYIDDTLIDTISGQTYPLNDPTVGSGSAVPAFGWAQGFGSSYQGIMHRAQSFKVDPAAFDIAGWLAAEIAANAARW